MCVCVACHAGGDLVVHGSSRLSKSVCEHSQPASAAHQCVQRYIKDNTLSYVGGQIVCDVIPELLVVCVFVLKSFFFFFLKSVCFLFFSTKLF